MMRRVTWADSAWPPDLAPACPNCTSLLNSLAQVPLTQATTGFRILPSFSAATCSRQHLKASSIPSVRWQSSIAAYVPRSIQLTELASAHRNIRRRRSMSAWVLAQNLVCQAT